QYQVDRERFQPKLKKNGWDARSNPQVTSGEIQAVLVKMVWLMQEAQYEVLATKNINCCMGRVARKKL
ncbi:hypothetical protein FQN60_012579, partial [Etheostoma spectabile]